MGQIVGAALVSHHPGLFQSDELRLKMGNGADADLVAGFDRIRAHIDAVRPDTLVIFDTHWFTTSRSGTRSSGACRGRASAATTCR